MASDTLDRADGIQAAGARGPDAPGRGRARQMEVAPADSTLNRARFLIFVGGVCWLGACLLFAVGFSLAGVPRGFVAVEGLLVGAGLLSLVSGGLRLGRHDRVRLEGRRITITSGRRTATRDLDPEARVEVEVSEGRPSAASVWGIFVRDGSGRSEILVRNEYYLEFRNLAEMLAKGLGCPLVDRSGAGDPVEIPWSDLDLPFRERARRRPALIGDRVPRPDRSGVDVRNGVEFSWRGLLMRSSAVIIPTALLFVLFLYLLMHHHLLQIFDDRSLLLITGPFAAMTLVGAVLPALFQSHLRLGNDSIDFHQSLLGLSVTNQSILWSEMEEIRVFERGGTARIEIFSDRDQITLGSGLDRVGDVEVAVWLAGEIRAWAAAH